MVAIAKSTQTRVIAGSTRMIQDAFVQHFMEVVLLEKDVRCIMCMVYLVYHYQLVLLFTILEMIYTLV